MRMATGRLLIAATTGVSLLLVSGPTHLSAPAVQAANFHANPAPFSHFKQMISPAALLGLSRQPGSGFSANEENNPPGGGLPRPEKPSASAIAAGPGTQAGGAAGGQGGINSPPPGSIAFNNDPSAMEQNETSVTVQQTGASPTNPYLTDKVVGGVNDFRGFYYVPAYGCTPNAGSYCYPARNCVSLSGFSVSLNGGSSLAKSSCLPWVNNTYQPFGDPALDRDTAGNVYYGSLGFDSTAGSGGNGIIIERSTPALFDPTNSCQNVSGPSGTDNTNPCWTGQVVSLGNTSPNPNTGKCDVGYCTFADKDWVAVDRYSATQYQGDVYVTWNSFAVAGPNNGTSQMLLSRCHPDAAAPTGFDYCTSPITVSEPGDTFTGGGSYLTVTRDGHVLVAYVNFGTASTLYPIDYRIAVVEPGGATVDGYINVAHLTQNGDSSTIPCLPNTDPPSSFEYGAPCKDNMGIDAAAGVTFRLPEFVKIDADRTTGATENNVYTTFELCTLPQFYPSTDQNGNILYPGNCPKSDVIVSRTHLTFGPGTFSNTPLSYTDITKSAPGQQFFPYVSVDERTGAVIDTYNSTQDDQFQNMDSVYAQESTNGGVSFVPLLGTGAGRITSVPYQITKDPAGYFGQGAPACGGGNPAATGCPGYAPENGDYLEGLAYFGRLYTHYTGTYLQKAFTPGSQDLLTFFDGTQAMNQDDNFLNRQAYGG